MCILHQCLLSNLCAEWATALGTIFLASVTVIITFVGDSATRLIKRKMNYNFQRKAFEFLGNVLDNPGNVNNALSSFYNDIADNKIYLSWCNNKKLDKYIRLASELEKEWVSGNDNTQIPVFKLLISETVKLVRSVGDKREIDACRNNFPEYF